jgi:hypothetical protein
MLKEVFQHFFQPSTPYAKKLGYAYESIAIQSRYRRQQTAWQPHIDGCHKFFNQLTGKRLIILGSGPLIDVPMDSLLEKFEKIYLIDLVQPLSVTKKYKNSEKVECITQDITGLDKILKRNFTEKHVQETLSKNFLETLPEADVLVSCNLFSQLPIKPAKYISKIIPSANKKNLIRKIQAQHLSLLESFPGKSYLMSDVELAYRDAQGTLIDRNPTIHVGLPLQNAAKWSWDLAPVGEISKNFSVHLSVVAGKIR